MVYPSFTGTIAFFTMANRTVFLLTFLVCSGLASVFPVVAQTNPRPNGCDLPIVPLAPVQPSLWWSFERFEPGWVQCWSIDTATKQIDITLVQGAWVASDYVRRFAFLQNIGASARTLNYDVLLRDSDRELLAQYFFAQGKWQILPRSLGAQPFRAPRPTAFTSGS